MGKCERCGEPTEDSYEYKCRICKQRDSDAMNTTTMPTIFPDFGGGSDSGSSGGFDGFGGGGAGRDF